AAFEAGAGKDVANGVGNARQAQLAATAHDALDLEKPAAETAGRVKAGKVFMREIALPGENEGQGIAPGNHGRGAGTGGEPQRARFLQRSDHERHIGSPG